MRRPRSSQRGSALLLAIFFLMVTFFLAMALLELMPVELQAAGRQSQEAAAYYAADAGVQDALAYLEDRVKKGEAPLPGNAGTYTMTGSLGTWAWRATLTADPQTPPNGTNPVRVYEIRAEALRDGSPFRVVTLQARQESFAKFAWFEDQRDDSLKIAANSWHFDGPFHSNARIRIRIPSGFYSSNNPPTFQGEVTTVGAHESPDGVAYAGDPPYDGQGNPLPERYQKLYQGGRESLSTGVQRLEMPSDAGSISSASLGDGIPMPTTAGVHLGLDATSNGVTGGVVIVGDADSVTLAVETGGNRSATIKQGSTTTKVLEVTDTPITDPAGNPVPVGSTLVTSGNTFSVHPGITNGTIYGTGNIRGLQGVNKGRRTVAVDLANQKEVVLSGNLTRADTTVGEKPTSGRDSLGIVAYNVRIPTSVATSNGNPLIVYAAIFAGTTGSQGGLVVDSPSSRAPGILRIFGGLMMAYKPVWGTSSPETGTMTTGLSMDSHYDPNLASSPPPYFPTLAKFRVVSYREDSASSP